MTPYTANPFVYIFSLLAIAALVAYLLFVAADRMGLAVRNTAATVAGKQFNKGGKSSYTTIVDGQSFIQSQVTPETYVLVLDVEDERTLGLVPKLLYESLQTNDRVQVTVRRRRITGRLDVLQVSR